MTTTTVTAMQALIAGLETLMADETVPTTPGEYLTDGPADELPQSVNAVANWLAPDALILPTGHPNFKAHAELAQAGFRVKCGERDSFGWLSGVIVTPKGFVVYG